MANTYRAVSDRAKALHGEDVFEAEFTPADERDQLDGGHVEIVPRPYRVLVNNFTKDGEPVEQGSMVDLALSVDNEKALLEGEILERGQREEPPPGGNASRDEWEAYARAHGATDEDLLGDDGEPLGRNELRDKFAK